MKRANNGILSKSGYTRDKNGFCQFGPSEAFDRLRREQGVNTVERVKRLWSVFIDTADLVLIIFFFLAMIIIALTGS